MYWVGFLFTFLPKLALSNSKWLWRLDCSYFVFTFWANPTGIWPDIPTDDVLNVSFTSWCSIPDDIPFSYVFLVFFVAFSEYQFFPFDTNLNVLHVD
jgi:hypothetical protein